MSDRTTEADSRPTEWTRLSEYVGDYLRDSEVIGEDENGMEGEFTLTERDEYMREDAVQGLLVDERFLDMVVAARMLTLRSRSAEGGCPTCGARNGEHFGTRCADPLHAEIRRVLCPSPEPRDEVAWLIESTRRWKPIWACALPTDPEWICWEDDANKAIKFRTEKEALAFIDERKLTRCVPTEHMWPSLSPTKAGGGNGT